MRSIAEIVNPNKDTDSPIEQLVYEEILIYGLKPIPQYQVGFFYIDLAFPEIKLAIELDGAAYHSSEEQKERDLYRENRLKAQGWKVERFTGSMVHNFRGFVAAKIALKYFKETLSIEQKTRAVGRVVDFFTRNDKEKDMDLALRLAKSFLLNET